MTDKQMNASLFKSKLRNLDLVLGTWVTSPSTHILDAICKASIDLAIIDQEHGSMTTSDLMPLVSVCKANCVAPVVRPPSLSRELSQYALDNGAFALQYPNIDSYRDALYAVECSKYPPIGNRGFSPFVAASNYQNNGSEWTGVQNETTSLILNIEGEKALKELDKILSIDEVDCIFVGLFDLSKSLGIPGQVNSPDVKQLLYKIIESSRKAGKSVGTIATSPEALEELILCKANYIIYMVDTYMIKSSYESVVRVKNQFISGQ